MECVLSMSIFHAVHSIETNNGLIVLIMYGFTPTADRKRRREKERGTLTDLLERGFVP